MLKPFINCRAEARRSLSVGSSAATLYCGNRTCGKSDSGSWATCDNLQQPSSFQLEDKRLTHIDGVWASFKHSDLLALKSLEPLRNLRVSFAGGAFCTPFLFGRTFLAMKWSHFASTNSLRFHFALALGLTCRTSRHADELSRVGAAQEKHSEFLVCQNWLIFRVIAVIAWFFFPWEVTIINMTKKMPDTSANFWNGHGVPC